jgi:tetratricopeptide (TPR) repeat protein
MRTRCLAFVVVVLFLGLSRINGAQASKLPSVSQADPSNGSSDGLYSKEPYVLELREDRVRFEADGRGQRDHILKARIQSDSGVHEFGLLVYPYASSFETLDVIYVRVRKPDGTVLETPSSDIQELDSAVSREAPMYTDQREKHIAVKSLAVGDILEAHLRWTIHDPIAPGYFWFDHSYFRSGICLKEILRIDVPASVAIKLRNAEPRPAISQENGRVLYNFEFSNLKEYEESKIPLWERNFHGAPLPDVQMTSFASWEEVGKWFGSLERPKVTVTPEIKAKAEELTKGKNSDDEKLHALYDYVSTRFRYIGIDLGIGRYTPHAASEVLLNRYGDCKDKHTLFAALLQAVGIASYPALISSKHRLDPSFPSASLFDHVITAIPRGDSYQFLDTTPEVAPFGLLAQNIRDRQSLLIPANSPAHLVTTPADPPFSFFERLRVDSVIDANGTLEAKIDLEARGDGELVFRLLYRATPQNRWQELTQRTAPLLGCGGTVSDVIVAQPEDTGKPFSITFSCHRTDYPDWKDRRFTLPARPNFLMSLNEEQKLSRNPLPLGPLQDITYDETMKLPEGYSAFVPEKVEQKTDFAEFTATYSLENGAVHGVFHLKTLQHEIPGSERAEYSSFTRKIDEAFRRYIFARNLNPSPGTSSSASAGSSPNVIGGVIGSTVSSSPSGEAKAPIPSPSPAKPLYDAAKRASAEGNYATSAQLYEQAVARDPNYKEAWNDLGYIYGKLGQQEKSEAALRKALALDPTAKYAHYNLGNALAAQKKYDEAISEYQKEIQINSKNSNPHLNLGRAYFFNGQPDKAIPELETAANLTPNDPKVHYSLGLAYAKANQPEKATKAFSRSVELEPTAERKNQVAYEMALGKLQLDQAEKYADSAIEYSVAETKNLSLDHLSNQDVRVPASLGAYWDTLGWVKFQQGDISNAEKYLRCAWQIRSIGEIGDHLGQIYEKEGRKTEAIELYAMALAAPYPMPETRARLVALRGSETDVDRLTEEARANLAKGRSLQITNAHGAAGTADFWLLLVPGPKVSAVKFIAGDEALRPFTSDLETATFPNPFPETTDAKLLRRGKLTCLSSSKACSLFLMSVETVRSTD